MPDDLYPVLVVGGVGLLVAAALLGLVVRVTHSAKALLFGTFALGCLLSATAIGMVLALGPLGP